MPQFIMLCGLPGSGKSHWTKQFLQKSNEEYVVISSDDIIDEKCSEEGITYSEGFDKYIGYASSEMKRRFKNAILNQKNIILDQTNMSVKSRKSKIEQVTENYTKNIMVFSVPDNILNERLEKRSKETGKTIPAFVIKNMANTYVRPSKEEGWDKIVDFKL